MTIYASQDHTVRLADTLAGCPFYQNTGTQSCDSRAACAAHHEPLCITDEPMGGWESQTYTPHNGPNPILIAFREIDAGRNEYADWVRDFDENPHFWTRGHADPGARYPQYTPAELDHARRVLTRLAALEASA
ncbi:hypothetical protein [Microbacterium sp. zg-YB36]|uniref:hypothetical protein n=1 Tax=Microbacterium sp. zg-YB36 TaxID=2969407 RepID=UPI00214AFD1E|nr:hypothetical protein [Microbacterium sp. zg-YB36]MDL5351152.1 hypothetical protein [Microbacterium sp. zg-YB36]